MHASIFREPFSAGCVGPPSSREGKKLPRKVHVCSKFQERLGHGLPLLTSNNRVRIFMFTTSKNVCPAHDPPCVLQNCHRTPWSKPEKLSEVVSRGSTSAVPPTTYARPPLPDFQQQRNMWYIHTRKQKLWGGKRKRSSRKTKIKHPCFSAPPPGLSPLFFTPALLQIIYTCCSQTK